MLDPDANTQIVNIFTVDAVGEFAKSRHQIDAVANAVFDNPVAFSVNFEKINDD